MNDLSAVMQSIADRNPHRWASGKQELWFPCPVHGGTSKTACHATNLGDKIVLRCFNCEAPGDQIADALGLPVEMLFAYPNEEHGGYRVMTAAATEIERRAAERVRLDGFEAAESLQDPEPMTLEETRELEEALARVAAPRHMFRQRHPRSRE